MGQKIVGNDISNYSLTDSLTIGEPRELELFNDVVINTGTLSIPKFEEIELIDLDDENSSDLVDLGLDENYMDDAFKVFTLF